MKFVLRKRIKKRKEKEQEPKIDKEKKNQFGLKIWKDITIGWTKTKKTKKLIRKKKMNVKKRKKKGQKTKDKRREDETWSLY